MSRLRFVSLAASLSCALLLIPIPAVQAQTQELQEITRLYRQGQNDEAVRRIDSFLSGKGKDQTPEIAQARFLKGLIFAEQGKNNDAIQIFTKLTEEYPELPEPYNNLGVLYASQGQFEKSRLALEMAISTHPSYATAHENLGDIYARMASQSYDKALQLDRSNTTAQTKLALIKELVMASGKSNRAAVAKGDGGASKAPSLASVSPPPASTAKGTSPVTPAGPSTAATSTTTTTTTSTTPTVPVTPPSTAKVEPPPASTTPSKAPVLASAPATTAPPATAPAPPVSAGVRGNDDDVIRAINGWAKAWSTKDVPGYLAYYSKSFKVPGGESRSAWEKSRAERITRPKKIEVSIQSPTVKFVDATHAEVTFRQGYRSDVLSTTTSKTVDLVKVGDKWLIEEERIGR